MTHVINNVNRHLYRTKQLRRSPTTANTSSPSLTTTATTPTGWMTSAGWWTPPRATFTTSRVHPRRQPTEVPPRPHHDRAQTVRHVGVGDFAGEMKELLLGIRRACETAGERELAGKKLGQLLTARYGSVNELKTKLGELQTIRQAFNRRQAAGRTPLRRANGVGCTCRYIPL
jgi:hypothetical protein